MFNGKFKSEFDCGSKYFCLSWLKSDNKVKLSHTISFWTQHQIELTIQKLSTNPNSLVNRTKFNQINKPVICKISNKQGKIVNSYQLGTKLKVVPV